MKGEAEVWEVVPNGCVPSIKYALLYSAGLKPFKEGLQSRTGSGGEEPEPAKDGGGGGGRMRGREGGRGKDWSVRERPCSVQPGGRAREWHFRDCSLQTEDPSG